MRAIERVLFYPVLILLTVYALMGWTEVGPRLVVILGTLIVVVLWTLPLFRGRSSKAVRFAFWLGLLGGLGFCLAAVFSAAA